MSNPGKCKALAREIGEILSRGIDLDPKTVEYMESTFGVNTPEEMSEFFHNQDESDKEPVLQLVFFPDRKTREKLEPVLEKNHFDSSDMEKVASILTRTTPEVYLYHPFFGEKISIQVSFEYIRGFVSRLYAHKNLPEGIVSLLDANYPREVSTSIKVGLRCAKFENTPLNLELLERVLSELDLEENSQEVFDYLISLLEETKSDDDLWGFFQRKKIFLRQHLEKAKYIEQQVSTQPMEILMLQGANTLSISSGALENQLQMLEGISLQIFGQVPQGDDFLPVDVDRENLENLDRFFPPE